MSLAAQRPSYAVVPGWGKLPDGWSFVEATAVGVDSKDNVYVYNRGAHPVIIFDRQGKFLRSWGEGMTSRAHGITIGPDDTVWLTDDGNHTIRQYTADGKLLLSIGDPDKPSAAHGGKPFNRPTHVALSPADRGHLHLGRLRKLPRPQVRSEGAPPVLVGRARHRSRVLQHPAQHRDRRRGARLRGRPGEPSRPGVRREGPLPVPDQQPAPCLRHLRRPRERRADLRRRAAVAPAGQRGGPEHRGPRQRAHPEGRPPRPESAGSSWARGPASSSPRTGS